jgi:ERCC4-related helicase
MTDIEAAWLAGFLEGEGCFVYRGNSPKVQVCSTDKDVIEKAAALMMDLVKINTSARPAPRKTVYTTMACGNRAIKVMSAILPYMCTRRAEKIRSILQQCSERTGPRRGERQKLSKLKELDVKKMLLQYKLGAPQFLLAKQFNVSQSLVSLIVRRKKWAHVQTHESPDIAGATVNTLIGS